MKPKLPEWSHRLDAIDDQKKSFEKTATHNERAALVDAFQLAHCHAFDVAYAVQRTHGDHVRLVGTFSAEGAQPCVVTLEPVPFQLEETVDVRFEPQAAHQELSEDEEHDALSLEDVEVFRGAEINVGRVFCEHFGAALNPYPRAPGAALAMGASDHDSADAPPSPFAALKELKDRQQ